MHTFFSRFRIEIIIFTLALVLRVVLFGINFAHNEYQLEPTIHGDDGYYELSQSILAGHGFTFDAEPPYRPNPLRPPVWPYLIAGTAALGGYWLVLILELLMASALPVLGMMLAKRIVGERCGRWVGFLLACEPYSILLSFILYTETCFTFFFLISMLFVFRFIENRTLRNAVWAGLFLGIATLVKPTIEYFPILIPLVLATAWRRELTAHLGRCLLGFLIPCLALIGMWTYRNHAEFGVWGMSAQPAFNLYVYLVPTVLSIDNHTNFATELNRVVFKQGFDVNDITLANGADYSERAVEVLKEHKGALMKSLVITAFTFFTHDGVLTVLQYAGITLPNMLAKPALTLLAHPSDLLALIGHYAASPGVLILIARAGWVLATLLLIGGVWAYFRRERFSLAALSALLVVLYFMATTAINGLGVNARFRVPVLAFIFSFAVYGLFALWGYILGKFKNRHEVALNHHPGI